jgi:hypothetical protein
MALGRKQADGMPAVFGSPPPMTRAIPPALLIAAMAKAIAAGCALTREDVLACAGMTLPDGADGVDGGPPLAMAAQPAPEEATASCPPPPPTPEVEAALRAYRRKFGRNHDPWLWGAHPETEARILRLAVKRGRPVGPHTIDRLCNGWRRGPPDGAIL